MTSVWTRRLCHAAAAGVILLFLSSVARFYHPVTGFTVFIGLPEGHDYEVPALRAMPHADGPLGYDGQFYAQLALEPLLRDPSIDRAMDLPPYRARRILFAWTAYLGGLGHPPWILEAYALQNVVAWLLLAWLLCRWVPPSTPRHLALWTACLWTHGLLMSVRLALLDGPSLLLIAAAVALIERQRLLGAAGVLGIAALGRETNLLAAVAMIRRPSDWSSWLKLGAAAALIVLPLLLWQDYLWSIYRSTSLTRQNHFVMPMTTFVDRWRDLVAEASVSGLWSRAGFGLCGIASLTTQAIYLIWRRDLRSPWWRVAAAYAAMMFVLHSVVWDGFPGAVTRVLLPLTIGVNILLAREPGPSFWAWFVAANLLVVPALTVF
ncbi:MAG TPA: hypothetical protein VFO19_17685 [Vicinamibacterales bacterium]|nr:hypothetical protein [Vicinamibacterales bacterium]